MVLKSILNAFFKDLKKCVGRTLVLQGLVEACNKKTCDKDAPSKVFAHNFHREVVFKNIKRDRLLKICKNLDNFLAQNTISQSPAPIEKFLLRFKSSLCAGNQIESGIDKHLSRIVTESYFWVYCADKNLVASEKTKNRYFAKLIQKGLKSCLTKREQATFNILNKEFGGRLPILWVTPTESLAEIKSGYRKEPVPEAIRNALGLYWVDAGDKLLEIKYHANFLQDLHTPTIFDAGLKNKYFQTQKEPDGWGRTLHLKTLKKSLPEAVHWLAPLPKEAGDYERLGGLTNEVPDLPLPKWLKYCRDSELEFSNNYC